MFEGRDVMVALIGREPMPIVLAALQLHPLVLYGLYSDATRTVFQAIREVLSDDPRISCQPALLSEATLPDPFSLEASQVAAQTIMVEYGAERLYFNLTGGTKIGALALFGLAARYDIPTLYVDTSNHRLLDLSQGGEIAIDVRIGVAQLLRAHGSQAQSSRTSSALSTGHRGLLEQWVRDLPQSASLLKKVAKTYPGISEIQLDDRRERRWLRQLEQVGLLAELDQLNPHRARVRLDDPEVADYLRGTWLEAYTFQVCQETGLFDDVQVGVRVQSVVQGVQDELDVVASRQGSLWLFQCKSGKVRGRGGSKDIEQVAAITPLQGGRFAYRLFVAAGALGADDHQRAVDREIVLVDRSRLASLGDVLREMASQPLARP